MSEQRRGDMVVRIGDEFTQVGWHVDGTRYAVVGELRNDDLNYAARCEDLIRSAKRALDARQVWRDLATAREKVVRAKLNELIGPEEPASPGRQ